MKFSSYAGSNFGSTKSVATKIAAKCAQFGIETEVIPLNQLVQTHFD
jgi:menaquinone-dependent protoporphyrinogen IX oxidase